MNLTVSCCSMSSAGPLSGGISGVYACIYVGFTFRRVKVVVLPEYLRMLGNSIAERFTHLPGYCKSVSGTSGDIWKIQR